MNDFQDVRRRIEAAYEDRAKLADPLFKAAVVQAIHGLDRGELRVAQKVDGEWKVNAWLMQAVNLFFAVSGMETVEYGPFQSRDKIPLKKDLEKAGVRVVPGGVARFGSHLEPGAVLLPGFLNIIEDGAFIGSRCILVEGVLVEEEAVLGANVVITASTPIIDVTGAQEVVHKGRVPARSVVIPGTRPKQYPAGTYQIPCALIVGRRSPSTDKKVSLNQALRDFEVQV